MEEKEQKNEVPVPGTDRKKEEKEAQKPFVEDKNLEVEVMSGESDNGQQDSDTNLDAFFEKLFQNQNNV